MYSLRSRGSVSKEVKLNTPVRKRKRDKSSEENTTPSKIGICTMETETLVLSAVREPLCEKGNNQDTPKRASSCLHEVKSALHTSLPSQLLVRDDETRQINGFISDHVSGRCPGSLYISGPPGTGKTASVTSYFDDGVKGVDVIMVNCMRFDSPQAIFKKIYSELVGNTTTDRTVNVEKKIVDIITSSTKMILLVLDEIDQLNSSSQQVLYTIFEWPSLTKSALILISIANALDLTDRLLPRLQANPKTCPELIHFNPYTKDEIVRIIESRLADTPGIVDKMAVQFCARKVSSVHGDIRKALDICRRAVEIVEARNKGQKESKGNGLRVTVGHVASVIEDVYGNKSRASEEVPLQQKLVACSLLLLVNKGTREPMLEKLYMLYSSVCSRRHLKQESHGEFVNLLSMLEARGIVRVKRSKHSSMLSKVNLLLQEAELTHALQDKTLISSVLQTEIEQRL